MGNIEHSIKSRLKHLEGVAEMQDGPTLGLHEQESGEYIAFFPASKKGRVFNDADIERIVTEGRAVLVCAADGGIYIYD